MSRQVSSDVGERLANARRRKGLARRTVAELIGRSEEWLRQVETGQRKLDSIECAVRLAEVLNLGEVLTMLDLRPERAVSATEDEILLPIRRALLDSAVLNAFPLDLPGWQEAAQTLETDVVRAWETWSNAGAGRYAKTIQVLPGLLRGAAMSLLDQTQEKEPRAALDVYHLARCVLARVGQEHLAWLVADRAFHVAKREKGPALLAAAWNLASTYLRQEYTAEAEWLATAAARYVTHAEGPGELEVLRGALYLLAAEAAAGGLDAFRAEYLLEQAKLGLRTVGTDTSAHHIHFGPTEVGLAGVEVALRAGRASGAIRLAGRFHVPDDYPVDQQVRYYAYLAYLHSRRNEDASAVFALDVIAAVSPEDLRYNARVRQALHRLLRRNNLTVRHELDRISRLAQIM